MGLSFVTMRVHELIVHHQSPDAAAGLRDRRRGHERAAATRRKVETILELARIVPRNDPATLD